MTKINRNRVVLFAVFFAIAIAANIAMNALVTSHYTQYFQVLNFKRNQFLYQCSDLLTFQDLLSW